MSAGSIRSDPVPLTVGTTVVSAIQTSDRVLRMSGVNRDASANCRPYTVSADIRVPPSRRQAHG